MTLVRQALDAWNRGDLEWLLNHSAPKFEFRTARLFPDLELTYRGREGFTRFWNTFRGAWESIVVEADRIGHLRTIAYLSCSGSTGEAGMDSK